MKDRPHDIGDPACGAARLRPVHAVGAARASTVSDVEALPVDIVPVESITQIQQGDKKARVEREAGADADPEAGHRPRCQEGRREQRRYRQAADAGSQAEAGRRPRRRRRLRRRSRSRSRDVPKPRKAEPIPATKVARSQPKQEVKPEPVKQTDPKPTPASDRPTRSRSKTASISPSRVKPDDRR